MCDYDYLASNSVTGALSLTVLPPEASILVIFQKSLRLVGLHRVKSVIMLVGTLITFGYCCGYLEVGSSFSL